MLRIKDKEGKVKFQLDDDDTEPQIVDSTLPEEDTEEGEEDVTHTTD